MANEQNLKPKDSNQDREEAKRNGIKGGIASGIARRKRKSMREALEKLLLDKVKTTKGEMETQDALLLALIAKGIKGDVRAIEVIRDTIGEKPSDKTQFVDNEGNNLFDAFYKAVCEKKDYTR